MSGPPSSRGFKREREHSEELYSIDDVPLIPAKRQRARSAEALVPDSLRSVYEQLLSKPEPGLKFLYSPDFASTLKRTASRVAADYRVTEDEAVEEFRRLLAIKVFTSDEKANKISPTPLMDQLWHAAILDTQFYAGLQDALGLVIHHRPEGASDKEAEQRARRLSVMEGIYKTFFSTKPLESRPYTPPASPPQPPAVQSDMHDANEIRICVRTPAAHAIYFKVQPHAKFSSIITAVTDRMKISRKTIRLFHEGHRIKEDVDTIASRGVRDGDVLEVFLEQGGC